MTPTSTRTADVVVVGGGIAGSALATVLARDGHDVAVLERDTARRDKVRGEAMVCWGVAEVRELGLEATLLAAGGHYATRAVFYDEVTAPADAEAGAAPLDRMLPGVPGGLDVGHPEACAALTEAGAASGATVVTGVRGITVTPGTAPVVRFHLDDRTEEIACRLVVGADGRTSVVRRAIGATLTTTAPRTMAGGLLVDGLDGWPADQASLGTEGDLQYFVFPRGSGRARLYLLHDIAQRGRFAGPAARTEVLRTFTGLRCLPQRAAFADARPVGPVAFYPMTDGWTDRIAAPGVVLVGDAAGWSDPIIGQGLSVAMRDARSVRDALRVAVEWGQGTFAGYAAERRERMRRLRVAGQVATSTAATFTPQGAARRRRYNELWATDPVLGGPRLAVQVGPENVPAAAFDQPNIDRIMVLAGQVAA